MTENKQTIIKIKEVTKKKLDYIKRVPSETYNDTVEELLNLNRNSLYVKIKNPDADWKTVKRKEKFYKCPKCGQLHMSLLISKLLSLVRDYLIFGGTCELSGIRSALVNSKKSTFKTAKQVDIFLNKLKVANRDVIKIEPMSTQSDKKFNFLDLEDMEISTCYNCKEKFPLNEWREGSKIVDVHTCPKCNTHVIDDVENRSFGSGVLMCPKCSYYFDRSWELFNHIEQKHPTIDHLRFDERHKLIKFHPYECSSDYLAKLILYAKKLNYNIRISGRGEHHPDCLTISLQRQLNKNK